MILAKAKLAGACFACIASPEALMVQDEPVQFGDFMKFKIAALVGVAALALSGVAQASVVVLNFEDGTVGAAVSGYAGATFSGAQYFQCGGGCPAPDHGLFISGAGAANPFTVTFANLQSSVSFTNVSFSSVTANAYDLANNLVATLSNTMGGFTPNTLTLSGANISKVTFSGSYGIDDLSYSTGGAVPEPATWALMITGFGMAGSALRRRRAVAA
jgi:hypothetical protein